MTAEQIDAILKGLRQKMSDDEIDDATFYALQDASKAIRAWQTDGGDGDIPYQAELNQWGILLTEVDGAEPAEESVAVEDVPDEIEEKAETANAEQRPEKSDEPEEVESETRTASAESTDQPSDIDLPPAEKPDEPDPDDPLQEAYDGALALLADGRYHAACEVLAKLQEEASGRLQAEIARSFEEAQRRLARQVRQLSEKAMAHAEKQPNDFQGQRKLWDKVLEAEEDNETAQQALRQLEKREQERKTAVEIEDLRENATNALGGLRLPELSQILGQAQTLQQNNTIERLQPDIDDLVQEIDRQRNQLRDKLGFAPTLIVGGNFREAYRQAQEYLDKGVTVIFDKAGVILDEEGDVDAYLFYQEARKRFIGSLRDLAQQRLDQADGQKKQNPAQALKTLQDAWKMLRDDILSKEDRDELQPTAKPVEEAIQEVEKRLQQFEQARNKVLEADRPGKPAADKYRLYREAQEIYSDYPNIERYIESAQDALAAIAAGKLQDRITAARRRKEQDDFEGALNLLQAARREILEQIPQPKPDSSLSQTLNDVASLEEEITAAERGYLNMMAALEEVDAYLAQYEHEKNRGALTAARVRLEQLTELESRHAQTQKRRSRLIEMQGVEESWEQGQSDYRLGLWENAIDTLTRVAASDVPEKNEAVRLVNRAKAVKQTLDARQAEGESRWRDALTRYRAADGLFRDFDSDEYTERFQQEAEQALTRLKSLEDNDAEVQIALQQAQGWLKQAEIAARNRVSPLEKVEPIPEFTRAVATLISVRDRQSTLKDEVEVTLRQARKMWQETYRQGMKVVVQSNDVGILEKAMAMGQSLQENDLLYSSEDKQLWRGIQERFLDVQLQQLRRDPATSPEEIEANRRQRLDIAVTPTDELYAQYREAIEHRVRAEMGKEREKGVEAAAEYLKKEMTRPELYDNMGLFEDLMHLLWETGDWEEAQMRADGLAYRKIDEAQAMSSLWQGFTAAAQFLERGELEMFRAEMSRLYKLAQQHFDFQLLWERQQRRLVKWRVDWLVKEAARKNKGSDEEGIVAAAQLYAQAHRLNKQDDRVEIGLRMMGRQLEPILGTRCQQAMNLTMRQSLAQSLAHANQLQEFLTDILDIAEPLGSTKSMRDELNSALDQVKRKRDPWAQIKAQLDSWEKEKLDLLSNPIPFQEQDEGGWLLLQPLTDRLNETQRLAGTADREIGRLLQSKRQELGRLTGKADELNGEARNLYQALMDEDFDEVITAATNLEKLWPPRQADGFSGLEQIVRFADPFTQKEYRRLAEHKKHTQEQKSNLKEWASWAGKVQAAYNKVHKSATILKNPLDDLIQEKPLAGIAADCREILKLCEEFQEALDGRPEMDPLSQRAMDEQSSVNAAWEGEVLHANSGYRDQAGGLLDQIDQAVTNMKEPLRKLVKAMEQLEKAAAPAKGRLGRVREPDPKHVQDWLQRSLPELQACRRIDPLHDEVMKHGRRIRELEEKFPGDQI